MPVKEPLLEVDDLIVSIFDGINEDRPWHTFLNHLRIRTDSEVATLSLRTGGKGVKPILLVDRRYDISKEIARKKADEYAKLVDIDPISMKLTTSGEILKLSDISRAEELADNEFCQVFMKEANVERYIGMCFAEANGWKCLIRLMNRPDMPDYDASDEALLKQLLPHLECALSLFAELRQSRSELCEFRASLDRLTIGAVILDSSGRIVDSNKVATQIIDSNPTVSAIDGKLVIKWPGSQSKFDTLLKQALAWADQDFDSPFVESLSIETGNGASITFLIRTVQKIDRYVGTTSPAVVVYISNTLTPFHVHENLLEKLFNLTATEARLASLIAGGHTLSEAASVLGVTENTVRGYSKTIFSKLGVNRQADLVRIILKSVAILA